MITLVPTRSQYMYSTDQMQPNVPAGQSCESILWVSPTKHCTANVIVRIPKYSHTPRFLRTCTGFQSRPGSKIKIQKSCTFYGVPMCTCTVYRQTCCPTCMPYLIDLSTIEPLYALCSDLSTGYC